MLTHLSHSTIQCLRDLVGTFAKLLVVESLLNEIQDLLRKLIVRQWIGLLNKQNKAIKSIQHTGLISSAIVRLKAKIR
jgi:hypothetical protein